MSGSLFQLCHLFFCVLPSGVLLLRTVRENPAISEATPKPNHGFESYLVPVLLVGRMIFVFTIHIVFEKVDLNSIIREENRNANVKKETKFKPWVPK